MGKSAEPKLENQPRRLVISKLRYCLFFAAFKWEGWVLTGTPVEETLKHLDAAVAEMQEQPA